MTTWRCDVETRPKAQTKWRYTGNVRRNTVFTERTISQPSDVEIFIRLEHVAVEHDQLFFSEI